jgi:hypothetical protein
MIRVHFAERESAEYDANEIEFTAAGAVILRRVELAEVVNPQDVRQKMRVPTGPPVLLGAWSRDARWVHVEEFEAAQRPLEVAT